VFKMTIADRRMRELPKSAVLDHANRRRRPGRRDQGQYAARVSRVSAAVRIQRTERQPETVGAVDLQRTALSDRRASRSGRLPPPATPSASALAIFTDHAMRRGTGGTQGEPRGEARGEDIER